MSKDHLATMIYESARKYGEKIAMRWKVRKEWKETSYATLGENVRVVAKALLEYGIQEGDMVGIFSQNRPEWALADFGILSVRGISVPIYATNTAKQTEYIVNDAQIKFIFVGDQGQYDKVRSFIQTTSHLKRIVAFGSKIKLSDDNSIYFDDFLKKGEGSSKDKELEERLEAALPDDIATLIYTSGTTGDPKGAMLTHANFFHQFYAIAKRFNVGTNDKSLCFLPLSHAYERCWSYYVFRSGAENNYLSDPKQIVRYMPMVKPTAMVSVPRLYEKIYSTVYDSLEKTSPSKKMLFHWAVKIGKKYQYKKKDRKIVFPLLALEHGFADKMVLSKIRNVVGGKKNFFSAGGAPLAKEIEEFFFAAGLLVCQGYGLTETSPMLTCNSPNDFKFGTVGKPIFGCQIKIGENGEILAKGGNIMKGYYNKPNETKEVFTEDGWFKTGDVGVIDEDGFLRITDRIKDLVITAQGKNVAPQHIETMIGKDHYIEQIAVIGDQKKFISALIVPSFPVLEEYAKQNNIIYSSREELVKKPEIIQFYQERIKTLSVELADYEKIKKFTLMSHEFSQESGELTPTQKIMRKVIVQKYKDLIDVMYRE